MVSTRESMIENIIAMIKQNGFDPEEVRNKSFYELEEMISVGHYKLSSITSQRIGYISRGTYSKKKVDEIFRYLLNYE